MLGSLQLETEDEPRRGASRANSVRFDESALHGHFAQGSRSSSDFFPLRTGSGLGSHPMTERSSSHKSDGRQSSAGVSTHSARLNSLGMDSRQPALTNAIPLGPPPGLFILGPFPSIIRCWLDTNFSNDSLLYAAICTGSCKSVLGLSLTTRLGLQDHITSHSDSEKTAKLQVYLPEATVQQSSTRSASPAPQLPVLTVNFSIYDLPGELDAIQIFIGSDILRLRNADIFFSQDRLTLLDDARNRLTVPLVRPENRSTYQDLRTISCANERSRWSSGVLSTPTILRETTKTSNAQALQLRVDTDQPQQGEVDDFPNGPSSYDVYTPITNSTLQEAAAIGDERVSALGQANEESNSASQSENHAKGPDGSFKSITPDTPTRTENGNIWGPWRRDSGPNMRQEPSFSNVSSNSPYQRTGRGRGMKVLKPARSNTASRSTSVISAPLSFGPATAIAPETGSHGNQAVNAQLPDVQPAAQPRRSLSVDVKSPLQSLTNKPRSANPIGGASAFGWLNSSQQKRTSTTAE